MQPDNPPDLIVIGTGLFGLTIAENAARIDGAKVLMLEKRSHIGGNAWGEIDAATGIEIHRYGPHIFHTSNEKVWQYANRFTEFNDYRHQVVTKHGNRTFPFPINLLTISAFYGQAVGPAEARQLLQERALRHTVEGAKNLQERAIATMGIDLYEAFVKNYTQKQWNVSPTDLPAATIGRVPVRFNYNTAYFTDTYQGLPKDGYAAWLTRMCSNPNIQIQTNVDFLEVRDTLPSNVPIVYTGPLDRYFGYPHGRLNWRTVDLEFETHQVSDYQGASVMNFADADVPWTRIVEFKHFYPERSYGDATIIAREYSRQALEHDEPYYPVNSAADRERLALYRRDAESEPNVYFGGRLGTYTYMDMHAAIGSALTMYEKYRKHWFR